MPKKRQHNLKRLEGTSQSNQRRSQSSTTKDGKADSVNTRLHELRLAEPAEANQKKRDIADSVAIHSVPPLLNNILGVPAIAPPQARPGTRFRLFTRTPGPAAPSSWLQSDQSIRSAGDSSVTLRSSLPREKRDDVYLRFQRLTHEDQVTEERQQGSLSDTCLRLLATNLDAIDDADYEILLELPFQVRLRLLSYLALCGTKSSAKLLNTLLAGPEPVHELNLSGLVGNADLDLSQLASLIKSDVRKQVSEEVDTVDDSWDSATNEMPSISSLGALFANLTHLSLSHPPSIIKWRDLLTLTKLTPRLTHLSIAHWPRPTLTPNLATTTFKNDRGPDVAAGGSHFYSEYDADFAEPISLLRQLSSNLRDLVWLDIEGCSSWTDAFYKLPISLSSRSSREWSHGSSQPLLASIMRKIEYIRLAGDVLPIDEINRLTPGVVIIPSWNDRNKMVALMEVLDRLRGSEDVRAEALRRWCRRALDHHSDAETIRIARRAETCSSLTLDYGWTKIVV